MNPRTTPTRILTCALAVAAMAACAALGGCASQPAVNAHIESVNAEYRQLEDYVYCLEDENARLEQRNKELQADYDRVRAGLPPKERGGLLRPRSILGSGPASTPPAIEVPMEPPSIEIPEVPSLPGRSTLQRPSLQGPGEAAEPEPPSIEIPSLPGEAAPLKPATPPKPAAPKATTPTSDTLPLPAGPASKPPGVPELLPVKPADPKVTHIHLNPLMTGGADFDGQPGDEGLSVLLEPRNAVDEFVPTAGAVSVVVLDPAKQGDAARVARWDFTLSAAQQKLAAASATRGIQFEMPWPANPPASNKLKLFVRYEGPDGRQLQTDRDLYITPPGQIAQRWTPRPAERARPASAAAVAASTGDSTASTDAASVAAAVAAPSAVESTASTADGPALTELKAQPKLVSPPAELSGDVETASAATDWSPYR